MSVEYGSDRPNLDARLQGLKPDGTSSNIMTALANTQTTFTFTFPFTCLFNGIDMYNWDANKGDTITFLTEYNAGPYGWKRYKKFGKDWNVIPNNKERLVLFPTEPSTGVRIKIIYDNKGQTDVDFCINLFIFTNMQQIKPSNLEEGDNW